MIAPDAVKRASDLLQAFGGTGHIIRATSEDLTRLGLSDRTVECLGIIRAAFERCLLAGCSTEAATADWANFWRFKIGTLRREVFEVGYLDSSNRLLPNGIERLHEGTVDRAVVYPRQIVAAALRRDASAVVLAHNHPNGRVEPTQHDKDVTRAVVLAADVVDLRVVDHFIVSTDGAFSFRAHGLL